MNLGAASALALIIFPVSSYHNILQYVSKISTMSIALNSHFSSISKPLDQFCSKEEHINSNLYIPSRMLSSLTVFLIFAEPKKPATSGDVNTRVFSFLYGRDWLGVLQRLKTPFNKTIDLKKVHHDMINRGFRRGDKKNIPDIHRAVKIYRISGAALTCSLITVRDKTTSSKLGRRQKQKD